MQPVLHSRNLFLRAPLPEDEMPFVTWAQESDACCALWMDPPRSSIAFRSYVQSCDREDAMGYVICDKQSNAIKGAIHLEKMFNGNFQNAFLGYHFNSETESEEVMRTALRLLTKHVFTKTKLHRLEVQVQPKFQRFINTLKSEHFRLEGVSPRLLKIAGRWRDCERYAITAEDWHLANSY